MRLPLHSKPAHISYNTWTAECKILWTLLTRLVLQFIWFQRNHRVYEQSSRSTEVIIMLLQKHLSSRIMQLAMALNYNFSLWSTMQQIYLSSPNHRQKPAIYLIAFFDGGSRGNPGQGGSGAWILAPGLQSSTFYISTAFSSDLTATNNQAEYTALALLVNMLLLFFSNNPHIHLTITGDSQMIINQLNGK